MSCCCESQRLVNLLDVSPVRHLQPLTGSGKVLPCVSSSLSGVTVFVIVRVAKHLQPPEILCRHTHSDFKLPAPSLIPAQAIPNKKPIGRLGNLPRTRLAAANTTPSWPERICQCNWEACKEQQPALVGSLCLIARSVWIMST